MAGERPSPIRFFPVDHPAMPHTLRGRLEARRKELTDAMVSGFALDFADYRYRAGQINGIEMALSFCADVEAELKREN